MTAPAILPAHVEALAREEGGWSVYIVGLRGRRLIATAHTLRQVQVALASAARQLHNEPVSAGPVSHPRSRVSRRQHSPKE